MATKKVTEGKVTVAKTTKRTSTTTPAPKKVAAQPAADEENNTTRVLKDTAGTATGTRVLTVLKSDKLKADALLSLAADRTVSDTASVMIPVNPDTAEIGGELKKAEVPCIFTDGEFRGDFTRDTFDPCKSYVRVLMQQGRVQLDADWNEQASILLRYLQALAADIIGPFGGPEGACGFQITTNEKWSFNFGISRGRYYINGILCENYSQILYTDQLTDMENLPALTEGKTYIVYLDAWERSLTGIEDPAVPEVALGGPDTAARAKIEWMVRASDSLYNVISSEFTNNNNPEVNCHLLKKFFSEYPPMLPVVHGRLAPVTDTTEQPRDICTIHPDSRYRGAENQLYRVEIHTGGTAGNATFKWSRENGSVQFPVLGLENNTLILGNLGKDDVRSLKNNDLVEIVDDDIVKMNSDLDLNVRAAVAADPAEVLIPNKGKIYRVRNVDRTRQTVTFDGEVKWTFRPEKHPLLRRWDQPNPDAKDNCLTILESGDSWDNPIPLEDGISVRFFASYQQEKERDAAKENAEQINTVYIPGSYWLIPARVINGGPDWPKNDKEYKILPPHGTMHHYAPLCMFTVGKNGIVGDSVVHCMCKFPPMSDTYCLEKE